MNTLKKTNQKHTNTMKNYKVKYFDKDRNEIDSEMILADNMKEAKVALKNWLANKSTTIQTFKISKP